MLRKERRKTRRYTLETDGTLSSDGSYWFVRTRDISHEGSLIEVRATDVPIDGRIATIQLDGAGIGALARVRWQGAGEDGATLLGLQFVKSFQLNQKISALLAATA